MRILSILGQKPEMTGSGVLVHELWKSSLDNGDDNFLIIGTYPDEWYDHIFKDKYDRVTFSRQHTNGEVLHQIPGMSDVMPYESIRYSDLNQEQVFELINAYRKKIDSAVEIFRPDVIHIHHLWVLIALAKYYKNIPIFVTIHGTGLKQYEKAKHLRPIVENSIKMISHFFSVSNDISVESRKRYKIKKSKITVIGNGYNPDLFFVGSAQKPKIKIIASAGKFVDWKGFKYLIRACSTVVEPFQLVIIGTGNKEEVENLHKEAAEHGLSKKINFLGHLKQEELAEWLRQTHVFVLPSIYEPFGLVLIEALACGCRTVSSNIGGPPDIVSEQLLLNEYACLVPPLTEIQPSDEERYCSDLSSAISEQLNKELDFDDRVYISNSIKKDTWDSIYSKIRNKYIEVSNEVGQHEG